MSMIFQNSKNYPRYIDDYQELVYKYYSQEYPPFEVVYYNVDTTASVVDKSILEGGSYTLIGNLSGWKWNKIFFLPVFFIDSITSVMYDGSERGVIQQAETSFVIPDTYGIIPNENDLVYFPTILNPEADKNKPMFIVKSIEKDIISKTHFYKCACQVLKYNPSSVDNHVSNNLIFVDYIKKIFGYDTGICLISFLDKIKALTIENTKSYNRNLDLFVSEIN